MSNTERSLPEHAVCEAHDCTNLATVQEMARGPRLLNLCGEHRDWFCHGCKSVGWLCEDCMGNACGCNRERGGDGCVCL